MTYKQTTFNAQTQKIEYLARREPRVIEQLENLFEKRTSMYIDYANVRPWSNKLGWHVDLRRLKQFIDSFDPQIRSHFYTGTLSGDKSSEKLLQDITQFGYQIHTKPVKIKKISIDASSINLQSLDLLSNFIRPALLKQLDLITIQHLNQKLLELNKKGVLFIEDRKCNFDVEIGRDMLLDFERKKTDTFILWSGDSDFADPVSQLLHDQKRVIIFATARRIAVELSQLSSKGLFIFDIAKIRNFICWNREILAKGTPVRRP
jgi:uncharacterized LabA/DUF88 family protein